MCALGGCDPVQRHSSSGDSSGEAPGWSRPHPGHTEHQLPGRKHTGRTPCFLLATLSFLICMQVLWECNTSAYSFITLSTFTSTVRRVWGGFGRSEGANIHSPQVLLLRHDRTATPQAQKWSKNDNNIHTVQTTHRHAKFGCCYLLIFTKEKFV